MNKQVVVETVKTAVSATSAYIADMDTGMKTSVAAAAVATSCLLGAAIVKHNKGTKAVWKWKGPASERHAYFVGGGLGSLSGAAYLIRDCGYKGENIHIHCR
ncbi:oleate hydratase [Kipferlia bialata]|uniref:Oleate hydratase n=1 Tax=Kipferlia bialata TaxID=797122 RepID=A0A9K3GKN6_9EUKA|nr:oleate hydratase [Kipferlia bialata]|eukprot:g8213.t1